MRLAIIPINGVVRRSTWVAKMAYKPLYTKKVVVIFLFIKKLMLLTLLKMNVTNPHSHISSSYRTCVMYNPGCYKCLEKIELLKEFTAEEERQTSK